MFLFLFVIQEDLTTKKLSTSHIEKQLAKFEASGIKAFKKIHVFCSLVFTISTTTRKSLQAQENTSIQDQKSVRTSVNLCLKTADMCVVIQFMHQLCGHHHHWEPVEDCDQGFNSVANQCNGQDHDVTGTQITEAWPFCCETCLYAEQESLKQCMFEVLIRLKAATMEQPTSAAVLDWRFRKWGLQYGKEMATLCQTCGYQPVIEGEPDNIDGDEPDPGWQFPVGKQAIKAQLNDLDRRCNRGDKNPELDFWHHRSN